jgi:hypothetical protein
VLASGTQDRGFAPDRSRRIFRNGKIHSTQYDRTQKGQLNKKVHETYETRTIKKKKIPVGARFFAHVQTGPGAHPVSCTMGTGSFPGVKRLERGADYPPILAPRSRINKAIPLLPL